MAQPNNSLIMEGRINGQALWKNLREDKQKMKSGWCRTYVPRQSNVAKAYQLKMMLDAYLQQEQMKVDVSWSGVIEGVVRFRCNKKDATPQDMNRFKNVLKQIVIPI